MHKFDYVKARSLEEALAALSQGGEKACALAGGTDLLVGFRAEDARLRHIELVVDIGDLTELAYIREENGCIAVGALATHAAVAESPLIREAAPFLAAACSQVGSPQIRNRGTVGGNLCNASPAADTLPVLVALEAEVVLRSPAGERRVPVSRFVKGPHRTDLRPGELVTEIRFNRPLPGTRTCFIKLGRRKAMSIARLSIAVLLKKDGGGTVEEVRLVPGAALPVPARVTAAEEIVRGQVLTVELAREAGEKLAQEMVRITGQRWSTPYKVPAIAALTRRAILTAGGLEDVTAGSEA
ncbi:MAG: xanthine dehydrogenase family protein subunit M [Thermoanaerobacteraceae bacterium]|nr:xanthine dehydrogenase family protein subunit M [Thermoanaerobacteraceae bacterium]